jgi:hypothetical protein
MATRKKTTRKTSSRKKAGASRKTSARKKAGTRKKAPRKTTKKYGARASKKVGRAMHEMKRGELRSGGSKKKVKSRKQAIAIGLSEARRSGAKVPRRSS